MKSVLSIITLTLFMLISCSKNCEELNSTNKGTIACSTFFEHKQLGSSKDNIFLYLEIHDLATQLVNGPKYFELPNDDRFILRVVKLEYGEPQPSGCSSGTCRILHVVQKWEVQSAVISAEMIRPPSSCDRTFSVNLTINDARLVDEKGEELYLTNVEFLNENVSDIYL